jgi:cyclopropane fatty-acyl-phospholipid synthase-like methyltransferase
MTQHEFIEIIRPLAGDPNADGFDDRLDGYHDRCRGTFTQLLQHLPKYGYHLLDVGCGMGGIGLLLVDHYIGKIQVTPDSVGPSQPLLDLLDGDVSVRGISGHRPKGYQSFGENNKPWNDATATAQRFRSFGYDTRALTPDTECWGPNLDVIVSTRSWGHHYPVDVYLKKAYEALTPEGIMALEIRYGTEGVATLLEFFKLVDQMPAVRSTKCGMYVFKKK